MALTLHPYGMRAINAWGGRQYVGSTRMIKIASSYSTSLYNGEAVNIHTDGTIIASALTSTPRVIGVFRGCAFTQASGTRYFTPQNYWPASTVASDALAYVEDDPFALFQVQADGTVPQASLAENVDVSATSGYTGLVGSTVTGLSAMAANATTATTNTLPWRLVDFVNNPGQGSSVGDTYTELVVAWNFGIHSYLMALGF